MSRSFEIPKDVPTTDCTAKATFHNGGMQCGAAGNYANKLNLDLVCQDKNGKPATKCKTTDPVYYGQAGGASGFEGTLNLGTTLVVASADGTTGTINSAATPTQPYVFGCTPACKKPKPPASDNVWVANWKAAS